MIVELKDIIKGDKVSCLGYTGFCDDSVEEVKKISYKFDEDTGEKYKIIHLSGGRKFDCRNGNALTPPTMYYLASCEQ